MIRQYGDAAVYDADSRAGKPAAEVDAYEDKFKACLEEKGYDSD